MEKFMLLVREDLKMKSQFSSEDFLKDINDMALWVQGLAQSGNYVDGEPLAPTGAYLGRDNVLSDGPFIEAKEAVNGYVFMQAADIEEMVAIAQTCPYVMNGNMVMEIRPVLGLQDIRELGDQKRTTGG